MNTEVDWPKAGSSESEWRAAVERLKKSYESLHSAIGKASEEKLKQRASNRKHSNYIMLHGIIDHVVYHSGQIAMLRRMLAEPPRA